MVLRDLEFIIAPLEAVSVRAGTTLVYTGSWVHLPRLMGREVVSIHSADNGVLLIDIK